MNKLDQQYQTLLQDILDNGYTKSDRTGTGTLSVFGRQIRHNMKDGFPLLTTKKIAFKTMVTELLWFLRGETNIKYLVDSNCHIWDGDAWKNYINNPYYKAESVADLMGSQAGQLVKCSTQEEFINKIKTNDEFAKKWGDLGKIYGAQWRGWKTYRKLPKDDYTTDYRENEPIDQIANLINDLKTNPDSRRMMVNAYNVGELDTMVLPPCHYGFQVYTRELSSQERKDLYDKSNYEKDVFPTDESGWNKLFDGYNIPTRAISLMFNMRSCDIFLGLPFNIASYGLLLLMIADEVNMVPGELIGNLGDVHLYNNHIEQSKEQIGRDLTDEERYHIWFDNNYETGMERFFESNNLPSFDDGYYIPTPKRTKEPYPLPTVSVRDGIFCSSIDDVILENYESHPPIKAPLSN